MTEKRPGSAPGVRLIEVSVKTELTVCVITGLKSGRGPLRNLSGGRFRESS